MPITMAKGTNIRTKTMGMAASQARLLTITARMHDVEYAAQSIQNAKVALATQSDEAYKAYMEALDATTLTIKDNNGQTIVANFNTLCGINAAKVGNYRYTLKDDKGRLIVPDDIAEDYAKFGNKGDAYDFAAYMLTGGTYDEKTLEDAENAVKAENSGYFDNFEEQLKAIYEKMGINYNDDESYGENFDDKLAYIENTIHNLSSDHKGNSEVEDLEGNKDKILEAWDKLNSAIKSQEYKLYRHFAEQVFKKANLENDFDDTDFWYYVNVYKQIEANGGRCVGISEFNGIDGVGNASTDSDWLQNQIQSGTITIDIASLDKNGNLSFASTGVPGDQRLEYTTTTTIDKTAYAKAEAEYEHKLKDINQKDKKFDLDLSKLETERTALKTEYDSVKKVVQDNIERTFGIFS